MKRESPKEIKEFQRTAPIPSDTKLRELAERISKLLNTQASLDITTTSGETFTAIQSAELARLVYLRFGRDVGAAHSAWQRMLQNNCSLRSFQTLLETGVRLHLGDK